MLMIICARSWGIHPTVILIGVDLVLLGSGVFCGSEGVVQVFEKVSRYFKWDWH